jgi:hypothetical protein
LPLGGVCRAVLSLDVLKGADRGDDVAGLGFLAGGGLNGRRAGSGRNLPGGQRWCICLP